MSRQSQLLLGLAAVLIVALWWFFVRTPGQEELERVESEIAAAQTERAGLEQQVARLKQVRQRAPETEAAIAGLRGIVPDDDALSSAYRQVQAAAEDAGVEATVITWSRPTVLDPGIGLHSISVQLTISGSYFQITDFLRRIEDPEVTSRGIIFDTLTLSQGGDYPILAASLGGQMFAVLEAVPDPNAVVATEAEEAQP